MNKKHAHSIQTGFLIINGSSSSWFRAHGNMTEKSLKYLRVSDGKNFYSITCSYARSQNGQMQDGHEHKPPPHGSVADVGPHSSGGTYVERSKNHWLIAHTGSFLWEAYPCRRNNPAFYLLNHHGWSQKQFLGQYCFPTLLKNNWNYQNNFLLS